MKQYLSTYLIHWIVSGTAASVLTAVASAMVRNLPAPLPMGSRLYKFFYGTVQTLLANPDLKRAIE
jgi:hypothetical protein